MKHGKITTSPKKVIELPLVIVIFFFGMFGMLLSTPPSGGADEPLHQATAWYAIHHFKTSTFQGQVQSELPAALTVSPCFAFKADIDSTCMPNRSTLKGINDSSVTSNYPPLYYILVGVGQEIAATVAGNQYADIGGRLASIIINLIVLFFAGIILRKRFGDFSQLLLILETPTALFFMGVVNPTGWEISTGVLFSLHLADYLYNSPKKDDSKNSWEKVSWVKSNISLPLLVSSMLFCSARPISWIWMLVLIAFSATIISKSRIKKVGKKLILSVIPGVVMALAWDLTHPSLMPTLPGYTPLKGGIAHTVKIFATSVGDFPNHLQQLVGNLGWLDTPTPPLAFLLFILAWANALSRLTRESKISRLTVLTALIAVVIIPSGIETYFARLWPGWWSGRYTLPLLDGILILLILKTEKSQVKGLNFLLGSSLLLNGVMGLENTARYSFGVNNYFPIRYSHPSIGTLNFLTCLVIFLSYCIFGSMVLTRELISNKIR